MVDRKDKIEMAIRRRGGSTKNPPILSMEFFIQNHADIVSCFAVVFVLGLLFQSTSSFAANFIVMGHNTTEIIAPQTLDQPDFVPTYTHGMKDVPLIFFYFLICIVMHAVVQEYLLDKFNKKLHLSKLKSSKFNESGQLLAFYLITIGWAIEILRRDAHAFAISRLWQDYPHHEMSYLFKFYFIIQIAYWLHNYPELFFQKIRKEEIPYRVAYTTMYFLFFAFAYLTNFTRICLFLSLFHYMVEALFHFSRLLYFSDKNSISDRTFTLWSILFVITRLATITMVVLTFWFRLPQNSQVNNDTLADHIASGNYNTKPVRTAVLIAVTSLQAWMMWNFITFQLRRLREKAYEDEQRRKLQTRKKRDDDANDANDIDSKKAAQRHARIARK